jgi:DHA2 family multidrug resistance protein
MDWAGIALLSVGVASLQYVLEEGTKRDWFQDPLISALAILSFVAIIFFVARELTAPMPAVNLSLFKDAVFMTGTLIGGIMFAMLMGVTFLLPVFMQNMLGYTAMQSGAALMPRALAMFVAMPIVGRIYNKIAPQVMVGVGILCFGASTWFMGKYTLNTSMPQLWLPLIIQGVALSCVWAPLATVALSTIDRTKLADATGLNALVRQIGGSIGLAIFATLMSRYSVQIRAALAAHIDVGRPEVAARLDILTRMFLAKGYDAASAHSAAGRALGAVVSTQANVLLFEKLFLLAGISFLAVMPLLVLLKSPKKTAAPKADVHVEM